MAQSSSSFDEKVLELIKARRSVRHFSDKKVPDELVQKLIEAGRWCPTAHNRQEIGFSVVSDRDEIEYFSASVREAIKNAGPPVDKYATNAIFYNAPLVIFLSMPSNSDWKNSDCSLAAQNMMLYATSLGLGSCYLGFAKRLNDAPRPNEPMQKLHVPDDYELCAPIMFGYCEEGREPSEVARKDLKLFK